MTDLTPKQFVVAFRQHGTVKAVWRALQDANKAKGLPGPAWTVVHRTYHQAVAEGLMEKEPNGAKSHDRIKANISHPKKPKLGGKIRATSTRGFDLPPKGEVYRYIFTCAQNNTRLHTGLWTNILAFADYYDADIHVSRFAYLKGMHSEADKGMFGAGKRRERFGEAENMWWTTELEDYISDVREEIAPGLVWCGEMNILPTAVRPLSGLEVYTGRRSGIFPHVKIAMESIASARGEPAKFNYTTGTVTLRNYIKKKAGLKAEFHHCYGFLLVEVDSEGDWFCRQVNANSEGTFYDLDLCVKNGEITEGHRIAGATWGDIHVAEADKSIFDMIWGKGGIIDELKPQYQFLHDVLHFRGRSHHEIKNPHMMFKRYIQGFDDVRKEVSGVGEFLKFAQRSFCKSIVVDSNHHHHLGRWLQEQDGRLDPINAEFWIEMTDAVYRAIRNRRNADILYTALTLAGLKEPNKHAQFLSEDQSFVLCPDEHGGIECGMHGDQGPNGSRGNALKFAKMGRRMNRGHEHSAGIVDGVYTSGTCGELNPDWTSGPSSWSHSHIITYANGKRCIITCWNNKWRAR